MFYYSKGCERQISAQYFQFRYSLLFGSSRMPLVCCTFVIKFDQCDKRTLSRAAYRVVFRSVFLWTPCCRHKDNCSVCVEAGIFLCFYKAQWSMMTTKLTKRLVSFFFFAHGKNSNPCKLFTQSLMDEKNFTLSPLSHLPAVPIASC